MEDSASSSEKGRLACWRTDLCDPVKDRTSDGIAIFYHGNWNYDGSVCPEYRSRKCTKNPSRFQGVYDSWYRLLSGSSNIYHDSRKIHDLSVCLRGCGYYHEFCGYLSEMYRIFLYSACNCEYLQKWNPGTRIRTAANDGRCC